MTESIELNNAKVIWMGMTDEQVNDGQVQRMFRRLNASDQSAFIEYAKDEQAATSFIEELERIHQGSVEEQLWRRLNVGESTFFFDPNDEDIRFEVVRVPNGWMLTRESFGNSDSTPTTSVFIPEEKQ
jgi:hypothetical protein